MENNLEKFEEFKEEFKFTIDKISYQDIEKYLMMYKLTKSVPFIDDPLNEAVEMREKYMNHISNESLLQAIFIFNSDMFNNSLLNQEDILLSFIQIGNNLNIVYIDTDNKFFLLLNNRRTVEITQDQYDNSLRLFKDQNLGLKKYLNQSLSDLVGNGNLHENTDTIKIKFKDHFEDFGGKYPDCIMFLPALLLNGVNEHRMTLLMAFTKNSHISYPSIYKYYDNFCLTPPGGC